MPSYLKKIFLIFIIFWAFSSLSVQAQKKSSQGSDRPFIEKGTLLTGFSLSFINASRSSFNQEFEREFTDISVQVDALYFVSDHIGVGPLLGYEFTYRDLVSPYGSNDSDTRLGQFEFGAKGGWFTPAGNLFGGDGRSQFFVDGGISWLRYSYRREGQANPDPDYRLGVQAGTGFLFPLGKQIALETKLGFRAREQDYRFSEQDDSGNFKTRSATKWRKFVTIGVGLKVSF